MTYGILAEFCEVEDELVTIDFLLNAPDHDYYHRIPITSAFLRNKTDLSVDAIDSVRTAHFTAQKLFNIFCNMHVPPGNKIEHEIEFGDSEVKIFFQKCVPDDLKNSALGSVVDVAHEIVRAWHDTAPVGELIGKLEQALL